MADDFNSKIEQAKSAGYSDQQIADYLGKTDERIGTARKAGYNDADIIGHLSSKGSQTEAPSDDNIVKKYYKTEGKLLAGVGDAALSVGSGALKGLTHAVNDLLPEAVGGKGSRAAIEKDINSSSVLNYEPKTEEGKKILAAISKALSPVAAVANAAHEGIASVAGEHAANVAGDVLTVATAGEASGVKALTKGATAVSKASKAVGLTKEADQGAVAAAKAAQDQGYRVPVTKARPTVLNRFLEGISGEAKANKSRSFENQKVTDSLVKKGLGIPEEEAVNADTLADVRRREGAKYAEIKDPKYGTVKPEQSYFDKLDQIAASSVKQQTTFGGKTGKDIVKMVRDLKKAKNFDTESAIDKISALREDADKAYRTGDNALGKANKAAANAIEDAVAQHLESSGAPKSVINDFKKAREVIAKSYSVQKSLTNGVVDARKLGKALASGKPMTGEIKKAAEFGQKFEESAQPVNSKANPISKTDLALAAAGHALKHPALLGVPLASTAARAATNSKIYQKTLGRARTTAEETATAAKRRKKLSQAYLSSQGVKTDEDEE